MNELLTAAEELIALYESLEEEVDDYELYDGIERLKEAVVDMRFEQARKAIND